MSISIRNIRYFAAVAQSESITGATQKLNISQSAITESIRSLEEDLGTSLFDRHARGMSLTHAGHQFLRHCHEILAAIERARNAITERPDTVSGTLNIGVTGLMIGYYLPYLLDRYRRVLPHVTVNVIEDKPDFLQDLLINGEIDVAIMIISNVKDPYSIGTEMLTQSQWRVWLPIHHALLEHKKISLEQLREHAIIMLKNDAIDEMTGALMRRHVGNNANIMRTTSVEAVRSLVATGAGVTLLPDFIYRPWSLEGDRLEARPVAEELPNVEIGVAWRRGYELSDATRNFLLIAREYSRQLTA
jgi:DNA-binding transcriptional LysR family regulator